MQVVYVPTLSLSRIDDNIYQTECNGASEECFFVDDIVCGIRVAPSNDVGGTNKKELCYQ